MENIILARDKKKHLNQESIKYNQNLNAVILIKRIID